MENLKEYYKKAEVYMNLKEYLNAFQVYNQIVEDNPEELEAYSLGLKAISYDMTRTANCDVNHPYPSGVYEILNEYVYRLKHLDKTGKYTSFLEDFQQYYNDVSCAEDFLNNEKYFATLLENYKKSKNKIYYEDIVETYHKMEEEYQKMSEKQKERYQEKFEKWKTEFDHLPKPKTGIVGFLFP